MPVTLVDPATGDAHDIPDELVGDYLDRGFVAESSAQRSERLAGDVRQEVFGGAGGQVVAGAAGLARGATLGLSDAAARALYGDEASLFLRGVRDANPLTSTVTEIGGALAPTLLSGGAALPAGLASRAGASVAQLGAEAGVAGKIGAAALGGAAEGALVGAGAGVTELALSGDPLTLEHVASTLSSNALYGAAFGAGGGALGKGVELGIGRAKQAVDAIRERAALARAAGDAGVGDLASLDAKGLRAARDAELDQLAAAQVEQRTAARSAAVDDAIAYRQAVREADPYLALSEGADAAPLAKAARVLRNQLDDVRGLRENPHGLLKPLRVEEQALERAIANRAELGAKLEAVNQRIASDLGEELATLPDAATHVSLSGKAARRYASYADVRVPKAGALQVTRDDAAAFLDALRAGEIQGAGQRALGSLDDLLARNRALQDRIKVGTAAPLPRSELTSERISAIDAARDALSAPRVEPLGSKLLGHTAFSAASGLARLIPGVGTLLAPFAGARAADAVTGLVSGALGKAALRSTERAATAASAFLDVAGRAASAAAPAAAPVASRVLSSVRYGAAKRGEDEPTSLPELYRRRTGELKALTHYTPDGRVEMRPAERARIAAQLDGVRAVSPRAADQLETIAVRRIEYLSSIMPRRPDIAGGPVGPDRYQPSELEIRSWARSVAAVEDPRGVLERAASGQVTPEDVDALRNVYPELLADFTAQVAAELPALRETLPYVRRLSLSLLTGVAVDPALDPAVLSVLQGQFPAEPGSEGGTQAPRAQPQFGSLKQLGEDTKTPAQERRS